jgi:NitT/TauT family transport system ATP-binding protein
MSVSTGATHSEIDATALIAVDNVGMTFPAEPRPVRALDQISLGIPRGQFVALLGPSGCGKSTLLRILGGLVHPTEGRVTLEREPVGRALRRRPFGFVFQDAALLPWRRVLANATLLQEIVYRDRRDLERHAAQAREYLDLMGLGGFLNAYPRQLSGGMRQRVAIARALAIAPQILLMDEPFGALDAITRDRLNLDLLTLWERTAVTIVFVTHSIHEAAFLADVVYVLTPRPGRILARVPVSLARPRTLDVQESAGFVRLVHELRSILDRGMTDAAVR